MSLVRDGSRPGWGRLYQSSEPRRGPTDEERLPSKIPGARTGAVVESSPASVRIEAICMAEKLRQVIIYPGEDGFWVAECPSLPGCISQGETRTEAITNIREAIEAYVAVLEEDGLDVPEERFDVLVVAV